MAAVAETGAVFHSRPLLATVVVGHLLAGFALFQLLDRARPLVPSPITVSLIAEPPPALEETPPQPAPQAVEPPPPVRQAPKVVRTPEPPPPPEPPVKRSRNRSP